ncbi:hypothetical protein Q7P35_004263 [Cladosporium inversicolor]
MSEFQSAIDDSFDPIPQPPLDEEYTDDSFFDNAYQGSRDGHWDVASSVGSFIDDRSPTVYGYHNKPDGTGYGLQIDEELAKRLMQATIEDKRTAIIAAARSPPPADQVSDRVKRSSAPSEARAPKPFFVPPLRIRKYNPVVPDIPEAADKAPAPPVAESTRSGRKLSGHSKASIPAGRPTPLLTAAQANAASDKPDPSPSSGRTIKILGKTGEVAFVDLPSLPTTYPQAPSSVRNIATDQPAKRSEASSKHDKQSQSSLQNFGINNKETNMIPGTRATANKEQTPSPDGDWAAMPPAREPKETHRSGSAIMSGALPTPSPWASPIPQSAAASCKDSGIAMGGISAVASSAGSTKTSSNKPGSAISQGVFSIARNIAKMASNSTGKSSSVQADPLPPPFDEVGMGVTTGFPAQKAQSERSNWMPSYLGFGSERAAKRSAGNDAPSARSSLKRSEINKPRSNYKPPTVRSASRSTSTSHHGIGSERASQHTLESHAPSSRTSHEHSKPHSARSEYKPPTVHSTDKPVHAGHQGFGSEKASPRFVNKDAPSAKSAHHKQEMHSNHKPPTVRSPSSSSSISHAFGGFLHDGTMQQPNTHSEWLEHRQSSTDFWHNQPEAANSNRHASNNSQAKAVPTLARLARPELHLDTNFPVSPLSEGTSPLCPSHSPVSPLELSPHVLHSGNQQTRFAGDGWISPHPLSVVTSDIGAPPQSEVYISADGPGHCGTLTYTQWRAQRDAANSVSGSFAGSRIPSASEPHIAPSAVYNYPPPSSFVGSYNLQTRQLHQLRSHADPDVNRVDHDEDWACQSRASNRTTLSQDQRGSDNSQRSYPSHPQSLRSRHNNSVYDGSVRRTPGVLARDADWKSPSEHDGSASGSGHNAPASGYNVGLTPSELANYHRQLSNTISRHFSRLSIVEQEQEPSQPDYNVWNSGQSRVSGRTASRHSGASRQSAREFQPNLSRPRERTQIGIPWNYTSSHASSSSSSGASSRSRRVGSQRQSSAHRGSQSTTRARETGSMVRPSHVSNRELSPVSARSNVSYSQATYGTEGWQDLENAEVGHGRFQSRYER